MLISSFHLPVVSYHPYNPPFLATLIISSANNCNTIAEFYKEL